MKKLLALLLVFWIVGCSNKESALTIICTGDDLYDYVVTFNFTSEEVTSKRILNKYGQSQKELYSDAIKLIENESLQQQNQTIFDGAFEELESKFVIREATDAYIIYANTKEVDPYYELEHTFNRATLKLKRVRRLGKSVIPDNQDILKEEAVSYFDCQLPKV